MKKISLKINSLGKTSRLASQIAANLKGGEVICLVGELGVGKTHFVKFFAEALGVGIEEVISPTFVYWKKHVGNKFKLNHFDFYRITDENEVESTGLTDAFGEKDAVTIIEWADRVTPHLPHDRLEIRMMYLGRIERQIDIEVIGDKYDYLLDNINV
ncbi:tRNA (adenosine(37)-N6)-threonylcarbamoyltransferase complex ATPase subunit type 1 TsaE [Candidatus Dojkabacteria bacterium]|nr:tRNA (adenosine(37)-N6)-threonylcarbamoyltransferase complex ATPase subunit type 1 TsaE [Candidatus Dojkabacteria bacterium]